MKTDTFTKIVLTVIAINLTILTVKNLDLIPKAYANEPTNKVELTPNNNFLLVPLNEDGSIDVNIKSFSTSSVLNVNLEKIGGSSIFGDLEVRIKGQPIKVEVNQ